MYVNMGGRTPGVYTLIRVHSNIVSSTVELPVMQVPWIVLYIDDCWCTLIAGGGEVRVYTNYNRH